MSLVWDKFPRGGGEKLVLLALADWGGDDGDRIWPSVATVAKKTNMSERQVQRILSRFCDEGILTITANEAGGRNNTRHYRMNIASLKGDNMSNAEPERVTSCPLKGDICGIKGDADVTRTVIEPLREPLKDISPQKQFDQFWNEYPRKVAKGLARHAFAKALTKTDSNTIMDAIRRYAQTNPDLKFTPHPATWLNHERWNDQLENMNGKRNRSNGSMATAALAEIAREAQISEPGEYRHAHGGGYYDPGGASESLDGIIDAMPYGRQGADIG